MEQINLKDSSTLDIRLALKEIACNNECTERVLRKKNIQLKSDDIYKMQYKEAISFLERKVELQNSEVKVVGEQLSREINEKEEVLNMLDHERKKCERVSTLLQNANKVISDLKKKNNNNTEKIKEDPEIKINKYRNIVKKKDEIITKQQEKIEELLERERKTLKIETEFKIFTENYEKLNAKMEKIISENEMLIENLKEKENFINSMTLKCESLIESQHILQNDYNELSDMYNNERNECKKTEQEMKEILNSQMEEICTLRFAKIKENKDLFEENENFHYEVYKNEIKRILINLVIDSHLRKKIEKEVLSIFVSAENSFNKIFYQITRT